MTRKPGRGSNKISRREFEKLAAMAAAGAMLPGSLSRAGGPVKKVALAGVPKASPDSALAEAVKKAALAATDFSWLSIGDTVAIKPALNSGNPYPATTSPVAIKAMVELLKEKGAARVIVTDTSGIEHVKLAKDGLRGSSRELMHASGMAKAALSAGAEIYFPEEDGWDAFFEDTPRNGDSWKNGITMPKVLKQADHIVLMPRCSRHLLAGSTLGMKAAVGWWRTDTRLEYHRDASTLQEKTAEANTVSSLLEKQRLTITAATRVQTTFGPDTGYVIEPETGIIFASDSVLAHDMVSLAWLLESRNQTPESKKKGLTKDPYTSQTAVANMNRIVVGLLGGAREAAKAEKLTRNDFYTIKDDRVIKRACEIFGGAPEIQMAVPDGSVSDSLREKLERAVRI